VTDPGLSRNNIRPFKLKISIIVPLTKPYSKMKKLFSTLLPAFGLCAMMLTSCADECCTYYVFGNQVKACKSDAANDTDWQNARTVALNAGGTCD